MEHKRLSRLLMLAGIIALVGGAAIFIILLPMIGRNYCARFPDAQALYWPSLIYFWLIGLLCAAAMAQYMGICRRIGQNRSFCDDNARGLKRIAQLLFGCAVMLLLYCLTALLPYVYVVPLVVDLVIISMAFAAMGMLAWALHRLILHAVHLQEENDLTI